MHSMFSKSGNNITSPSESAILKSRNENYYFIASGGEVRIPRETQDIGISRRIGRSHRRILDEESVVPLRTYNELQAVLGFVGTKETFLSRTY